MLRPALVRTSLALVATLAGATGVELRAQGTSPAAEHPPLWSFAPWRQAAPPDVLATDDPDKSESGRDPGQESAIDRFVRQRQIAAGIDANPRADWQVLLRRASMALLGLPPRAEQRERLAAQPDAEQFAALVDEMLASPHYGERQARHWLDLARYSDSNGLDENLAFAQAFRYRDWVVRAHNDDLSFATFGRMQIAGDLLAELPEVGLDGHLATGFLALGPRMLAEQDKEKLVLDTVDEQIDLVGRTFLGLTLGCARCHDHKFDPVSAADYYALAGIFKSTRSFRELGHVAQWFEREIATEADIAARQSAQKNAAAARQQLDAATQRHATAQRNAMVADAGRYLLAGSHLLTTSTFLQAEASPRTSLHADHATWGSADCGVLHTHRQGEQYAEWDFATTRAGRHVLEVRFAAQESRPMRVTIDGVVVAESSLGEVSGGWLPAHQQWFVAAQCELSVGSHVLRLQAHGPHVPHLDALMLTASDPGEAVDAAELEGLLPAVVRRTAAVLAGRENDELVALWHEATRLLAEDPTGAGARQLAQRSANGGLDSILIGALPPSTPRELAARYQTLFATAALASAGLQPAGHGDNREPQPKPILDANLAQAHALLFDRGGMLALDASALRAYLPATALAELNELRATHERAAAAVPERQPAAMCVADGDVVDLPIHLRGNHLTLAAEVTPRGFLSALTGILAAPPLPTASSGRRELADWMFDPRLPLAARVHTNRIWQRAFGTGLVRTPSNFGVRGDVPVHTELLDWLAHDFIAHDWSQKHLWRRILTSRTWQLASSVPAAGAGAAMRADPENRLWWRHERRRLDAESVRDAILFTAGNLDPTLGGSLLGTKDRDYVTNDQSNDRARYDTERRSLYLPVIRNAMYDLFTAFDYVDPSVHLEQRPTSAVATQALFLLNAPFVQRQCDLLATRVLQQAPTDTDARIDWLWQHMLGRSARPDEHERAHAWLRAAANSSTPAAGWPGLCQVLFASSEFLYID